MCLGIPGKIIGVSKNVATVQFGAVQRDVFLDIVDVPVDVNDYVLVHAGFAISKIDEEEARKTYELLEEFLSYEVS